MQDNTTSRKAQQHRNSSQETPMWDSARAAHTAKAPVEAKVESVATKDGKARGLMVSLGLGLPSFIPGSEIPKGVSQKALVGQTIQVHIIEVNRRKGRLISSLKVLADEARNQLLSSLVENQEVSGTVARITDFGYFVELGSGVDALLHVSQTALVDGKPEELTVGQSVTARVRSIDLEAGKVALTMRKPRPETHGNTSARRGNLEGFAARAARRTPVPNFKAAPTVQPEKPKGPRKLGASSKKRSGFDVCFSSQGGNPFEQLLAWQNQRDGAATTDATTVTEAAPAAEAPVAGE